MEIYVCYHNTWWNIRSNYIEVQECKVQHKQLKIYPNPSGHHKDHLYPSFFKASPFTPLLSLPFRRRLHPSTSHRKIKQVHVLFEGLLVDIRSTLLHGIQKIGECFNDISRNISFSYKFIWLKSSYEPTLGLCMGENTVSEPWDSIFNARKDSCINPL